MQGFVPEVTFGILATRAHLACLLELCAVDCADLRHLITGT